MSMASAAYKSRIIGIFAAAAMTMGPTITGIRAQPITEADCQDVAVHDTDPTIRKDVQTHFTEISQTLKAHGLLEAEILDDILHELPEDDETAQIIKDHVTEYKHELEKHISGEYAGYMFEDYTKPVLQNFAKKLLNYLAALETIYENDQSTLQALQSIKTPREKLNSYANEKTGAHALFASLCERAKKEALQELTDSQEPAKGPPAILAF